MFISFGLTSNILVFVTASFMVMFVNTPACSHVSAGIDFFL